MKRTATLCALCVSFFAAGRASAEPGVIKIGVIAELSGPFADLGKKIDDGIKLYLRRNGDSVAGKKVQVIVRNVPGPAPEVAKRLAQELGTQDGVDILAGFGLPPHALSAAAIASEAKKPMLIMNAATSIITSKSPYVARLSFTLPQVAAPLGEWAAQNGIQTVLTIVSDYGPGLDAERACGKSVAKNGGTVSGGGGVLVQKR